MWQPDGAGWRARIGLISAHLDLAPESEFWTMAPAGVSVHVTRVPLSVIGPGGEITPQGVMDGIRAFTEPPLVDEAAALLASNPLNAIVYGFTSSSYLLGAEGDRALKARLEGRTSGIPVLIPCLSTIRALRALGVSRIALVDPPWFPPELDEMGARYFAGQGCKVVFHASAPVRRGPGEVYPSQIYEWVRANVPESAEAVVIGGTGFRAIGAIAALEQDLAVPVLTANQVALWEALRLARLQLPVPRYGALFTRQLPDS